MPVLRSELATVVCALAFVFFLVSGGALDPGNISPGLSMLLLVALFIVMLWAAFRVVHHAECLAALLGEPYGTLILTVSVIGIEVALIASIMITGSDKPTLARDTMFSIVMIVLNGLVGLSLIAGGLRHRLQEFNLQGASAYLTMILPFALLGLVLPRFTASAPGGELSPLLASFLVAMSVILYGIFLAVQTVSHSDIFQHGAGDGHGDDVDGLGTVRFHAIALLAALLPIVLLSKRLAGYLDVTISGLGAPLAFSGFLVAALILAPEALSAMRAAQRNELQRSVNICLGSALSSMGLTIPTVLLISYATGEAIELGLENTEIILLSTTLGVTLVTFLSPRALALQGFVHLALFAAYLVLIFDSPAV